MEQMLIILVQGLKGPLNTTDTSGYIDSELFLLIKQKNVSHCHLLFLIILNVLVLKNLIINS